MNIGKIAEETEHDDVVQCDYSYDKKCHTSNASQQEIECEERIGESSFIDKKQLGLNKTIRICGNLFF